MSGWNSLSGYLHFRPGGGGLSILKTKRKVWCVLDEGQCKLVYYKNEEELRHNKTPIGSINIKGAGISLDLDTHNQFIILSDGKEYIFTAENHESLMIWLIGLQAKRESYIKDQDKVVTVQEGKSHCNKRVIGIDNCESNIPMGVTRRKVNWQTYKNQKVAESLDSALYRTKNHQEASRSRSLPPVFEAMEAPKLSSAHTTLCLSRSYDVPRKYTIAGLENLSRSFRDQGHKRLLQRRESSSGDSDEVFDLSEQYQQSDDRHYLAYLQKLDTIDSASDSSPTIDPVERKEVGSCSSLSSDSAIDRGDASSAELAGRLQDLEKELIIPDYFIKMLATFVDSIRSTKCELAKVMNRQSSYQELLVQREDAIRFLEGRLDTSSVSELAKTGSGKSSSKNDKDLQERLRVLQNQNKFLNEEVKKLAKLRETDRNSFYQQEEKIRTLEAEIEKWKLDYVLLIQSSIRFPTGDSVEDAELILFGGDRHKIRIKRLLEEARRINPGLPTYESLSNQEVHVDSYGFRHKFEDQSLLLHYLCQELAQHYLSQAGTYEEHQKRWTHFMRQHGKSVASHPKELKPLCRGGIPDRFRKQVWRQLVHFKCKDIMEEKGPHYFRNLCSHLPDSPLASQYRKQISLDLMRTMPSNIKFSAPGSKGIMDLQDVLLAYCCHNPTIGYCQGMNFIVGMALLFMDAQDAFWTLVAVAEKFFSNHYFDQNLIGAQADQQVLKDLLAHRLPQLYRHLEAIDIELSTVTLNWFLAIFFDAVPFMV
ncbi:TBC1D2B [Mytilus coruscus]|uniref:TBC1D2B n=1 Tax=Mytilus coruscus TaxID=42192 RepID=A0A6J8AFB9_MYTCO|nr:TBC1D2B [Mytilus coruscus]